MGYFGREPTDWPLSEEQLAEFGDRRYVKSDLSNLWIPGFRNEILNPGFNIAQRGTGPFTADGYSFDQWRIDSSGATNIGLDRPVLGSTVPARNRDGLTYYARLAGDVAAGGHLALEQRVEDVRTLAGMTVAISWQSSRTTGFDTAVAVQNFHGPNSAAPSPIVGAYSASPPTLGGPRNVVIVDIPSIDGLVVHAAESYTSIKFFHSVAAGSPYAAVVGAFTGGNALNITGVQVEVLGPTGTIPYPKATPFEGRHPGLDLLMCQRHYYRRTGVNWNRIIPFGLLENTQRAMFTAVHPIVMRSRSLTFGCSPVSEMQVNNAATSAPALTALTHVRAGEQFSTVQADWTGAWGTAGNACMLVPTANGAGWIEFSAEL